MLNTPRVAVAAPLVVVAASHQLPPTLPHVSLCRSLAALLSRHAQVCARQADAHVPVGIYCGRRQGHGRPQGPLRHHQPLDLSHRLCTRVCFYSVVASMEMEVEGPGVRGTGTRGCAYTVHDKLSFAIGTAARVPRVPRVGTVPGMCVQSAQPPPMPPHNRAPARTHDLSHASKAVAVGERRRHAPRRQGVAPPHAQVCRLIHIGI